ncbi:glutathione S-transferase [Devosia insulae DS-56]|uniref:Glutathione S-transferase n=1 Tax=Devosia insulae DS-56 TaxID=1116389 RepID=A0A1E5XIT6_9HYPH|nr:glutathione binding-like protein [Devosia insulae]OEO28512.1 glutathione S-transferase [Devosia insulae DS-56]
MKLYYAPLACSLADHIALLEAGIPFARERVDLKTKLTASGQHLADISGKGYVPTLVLDDGQVLTENIAVLDWIAAGHPQLGLDGPLGRTRLIEALTFVSTEIHGAFKPFWHQAGQAEKTRSSNTIARHFSYFAERMQGKYLFGTRPSVVDFYLFVMLLWARRFGVPVPAALDRLCDRIADRPAARLAMAQEGLLEMQRADA